MEYKTEQEKFWAGEFGVHYIERNNPERLLYPKVAMWGRILRSANNVTSVREFGCNIGLNLVALKSLNPTLKLYGYEINAEAAHRAAAYNVAEIHKKSIIEKLEDPQVDLTFTAGVLIHISPDYLTNVYENLITGSSRYVVLAEYYNPAPVAVEYRGHKDKLFKRDFAGDLIDRYGLRLVDYGFVYKRDNWAPQDDITWFLLEK